MKVAVKRNGKEWILRPLDGVFAGIEVMKADGIVMERVILDHECLIGEVTGVWGAVIPEALDLDRWTLRGLGVGGIFAPKASIPMNFAGGQFVDTMTGVVITEAAHVMLFGRGMMYNPVRAKRRT